jgi:gluconolactonase
MGVLEIWDAQATAVAAADAEWQPLAGGFRFVEGPTWMTEEAALYFSDIPADTLYRWDAEGGVISVFRRSSYKSNGTTRDPRGFLIVCHHGARMVSRVDRNGRVVPVATHFAGQRFNSPNDVVVSLDGSIWFTDPTYGIDSLDIGYPAPAEQPVRGVYRVDPSGAVTRVVDDMGQPNGLAFSPGEDMLYVADTERNHVRVFAVGPGGRLHDRGVLVDLPRSQGRGVADGLRVLSSGTLLIAGPGGVWVVDREGHPLGLLRTPEVVANLQPAVAPDGPTLFITATTSLYRLPLQREP